MPYAVSLPRPDDDRDAELRIVIRSRPHMMKLAAFATQWAKLSDQALAWGRLDVASFCEERAVLLEYRLGLLEDRLVEILRCGWRAGRDEEGDSFIWTVPPPGASRAGR
jgi:hypothetical protein